MDAEKRLMELMDSGDQNAFYRHQGGKYVVYSHPEDRNKKEDKNIVAKELLKIAKILLSTDE